MSQYVEGMTLQEAIENRMTELGLRTQDQVAAALGVTQSTVSRWTKGSAPRDEQVENLADFLGTDDDTVLRLLAASRATRLRKRRPTWAGLIDDKALVEKLTALPRAQQDEIVEELQALLVERLADYGDQEQS